MEKDLMENDLGKSVVLRNDNEKVVMEEFTEDEFMADETSDKHASELDEQMDGTITEKSHLNTSKAAQASTAGVDFGTAGSSETRIVVHARRHSAPGLNLELGLSPFSERFNVMQNATPEDVSSRSQITGSCPFSERLKAMQNTSLFAVEDVSSSRSHIAGLGGGAVPINKSGDWRAMKKSKSGSALGGLQFGGSEAEPNKSSADVPALKSKGWTREQNNVLAVAYLKHPGDRSIWARTKRENPELFREKSAALMSKQHGELKGSGKIEIIINELKASGELDVLLKKSSGGECEDTLVDQNPKPIPALSFGIPEVLNEADRPLVDAVEDYLRVEFTKIITGVINIINTRAKDKKDN